MKAKQIHALLAALLIVALFTGCETVPVEPGTQTSNDDWLLAPLGLMFFGGAAAVNPNLSAMQRASGAQLANVAQTLAQVESQQQAARIVAAQQPQRTGPHPQDVIKENGGRSMYSFVFRNAVGDFSGGFSYANIDYANNHFELANETTLHFATHIRGRNGRRVDFFLFKVTGELVEQRLALITRHDEILWFPYSTERLRDLNALGPCIVEWRIDEKIIDRYTVSFAP